MAAVVSGHYGDENMAAVVSGHYRDENMAAVVSGHYGDENMAAVVSGHYGGNMEQVKLKQLTKAKVATTVFGGYDHRPVIQDGSWYDAQNLTNDRYPVMAVRKGRSAVGGSGDSGQLTVANDGIPSSVSGPAADTFPPGGRQSAAEVGGIKVEGLIGLCDREKPLGLYDDGTVGCGGHYLQLLDTAPAAELLLSEFGTVTVNAAVFAATFSEPGLYHFQYDRQAEAWDVAYRKSFEHRADWKRSEHSPVPDGEMQSIGVSCIGQPDDQDSFFVRLFRQAPLHVRRQLVSMGAYVCIWPDRQFVNAEKLAADGAAEMVRGTDYGKLDQENRIGVGETVTLTLCNSDGKAYFPLTVSDQAPSQLLYWLDTSGEQLTLKHYSSALSGWVPLTDCCVKIEADSIQDGLQAGDGVRLQFAAPLGWDVIGSELQQTRESIKKLLQGTVLVKQTADNCVVVPGIFRPQSGNSFSFELTLDSARPRILPSLTVVRQVPEMDYIVECGNRLWGCYYGQNAQGELINEIYACKLGDFKNWNVFAGISTDSYVASRGMDGAFTGAAVYDGHPLFFRERSLEKVFPSASGAHQIQTQTLDGVQAGSDRSLCVIDERLYYKGVGGVYVYTGTLPKLISGPLGDVAYRKAEAGRCGKKLYLAMEEAVSGQGPVDSEELAERSSPLGHDRSLQAQNTERLFVYDTLTGLWQTEDAPWAVDSGQLTVDSEELAEEARDVEAPSPTAENVNTVRLIGWNNALYLNTDDVLWLVGGAADSAGVHWYAETGVLGLGISQQKYVSRIHLRYRMEQGAAVRVYIQYDESGHWLRKDEVGGTGSMAAVVSGHYGSTRLHSGVLMLQPRRCDTFRLRLEGVGGFELYDVTYYRERGSDVGC